MLIYFVMLKCYTQNWINWVWAAVLVVVLPYLLSLALYAILQKVSMFQAAMIRGDGVMLIFQGCVALGLFYWLEKQERTLTEYVTASMFGFAAIYFVAPGVASLFG